MRNAARACGRDGLGVTMSTPSCNSMWARWSSGESVPIVERQQPGQVNAGHAFPSRRACAWVERNRNALRPPLQRAIRARRWANRDLPGCPPQAKRCPYLSLLRGALAEVPRP